MGCFLWTQVRAMHAVADALEWYVARESVWDIYHYLDDFAIIGPPNPEQCSWNLHTLQLVCKELRISLAAEKQACHAPQLNSWVLSLTPPGKNSASQRTSSDNFNLCWKSGNPENHVCTRHELDLLIGVL